MRFGEELTLREPRALSIVEAQVALGWIHARWPGLVVDLSGFLPELDAMCAELDGNAMLERA